MEKIMVTTITKKERCSISSLSPQKHC